MEKETQVVSRLKEQFPALDADKAKVTVRRIFLDVPGDIFLDVIGYAAHELGFGHLCTITGLDAGTEYEFLYHIANTEGILLNLKLKVPKDNPVIASVLPIYQGSSFYERELEGLLGVTVEGLPEGRQYPLPDNWPKGQYPLRKDWTPEPRKTEE